MEMGPARLCWLIGLALWRLSLPDAQVRRRKVFGKQGKSRTTLLSLLVTLGLVILPAQALAARPSGGPGAGSGLDAGRATAAPAGLTADAWHSIRDLIAEGEYQFTWHEATGPIPQPHYQAPNRAQGWYAAFTAQGLDVTPGRGDAWRCGWTLAGYGYEGHLQSIAAPAGWRLEGNRLEFQWDERFREWYVNSARGLEQGFTLAAPPPRPAGSPRPSLLVLEMAVRGDLIPRLVKDGRAIDFRDDSGQTWMRYADLAVLDARGRRLPASLALAQASPGAPHNIRILIDDDGAAYPLVVDPLLTSEVTKLTAYDGMTGDRFGASVSVSGDTLIVGAYEAETSRGTAYLFERNQNGADHWDLVAKLSASDTVSYDRFGAAVSISGDTAVVGAWGHHSYQGTAYVFERNQGGPDNWGQVAKLTPLDLSAVQQFGNSVTISGDTIVVGAWQEDVEGNPDQGAAHVFARNQGGADNWGEVAELTASDGASNDSFGVSVAVSGDAVVVGAHNDEGRTGAAYVFARNHDPDNPGTPTADHWGEVQKLTASDGAAQDYFGLSVAISGDTVVVGADEDDDNGFDSGSAYVFARNQGGPDNWGEVKKLTASDGVMGDYFGYAVSISGDTALVGAYMDDDKGGSSGAVYLFARNQGGIDNWGQVKKGTASGGATGDRTGFSVSISGDTVVAGAVGYASYLGATYVFERRGEEWFEQQHRSAPDGAASDYFGYAVSISGDTAVVGAYGDDLSLDGNEGSAYVLGRNQGGTASDWGLLKKLTAADGADGDEFGISVSIHGDTLVVGAHQDDDLGSNCGAAYVFARNQGGADNWGLVKKLTAADGAGNDAFGHAVAIDGDTVVVGAHVDDSNQGAAYVFSRNVDPENPGTPLADNWGEVKKLTASDGAANDWFGYAISISGDTIVVGAYRDDGWAGAAYVFARNYDPATPGTPSADNWGEVKRLTASDGAANDSFGFSVAISGDTLVAGAYGDEGWTGAAYVFARNYDPGDPATPSADNWGQVAKLTASTGAANDYFGYAVSISGDTAIVGAYRDDDGGSSAGAAYVLARNYDPANPASPSADNWGQVTKLTASDGAGNDYFGYAVAISGDTAVVGAYADDVSGASNRGSVYLFGRRDALSKNVDGPGTYTFGGDSNVVMDVTDTGGCDAIAVTPTESNHPTCPPELQTGRYWSITPQGCESGYALNLTLGTHFVPDADSVACRYSGSGTEWDCAANAFDAGDKTVTRNDVTQLSDWSGGTRTPVRYHIYLPLVVRNL
jgi:hypothetical protein